MDIFFFHMTTHFLLPFICAQQSKKKKNLRGKHTAPTYWKVAKIVSWASFSTVSRDQESRK